MEIRHMPSILSHQALEGVEILTANRGDKNDEYEEI